MNRLYKMISELRESQGISDAELARRTGVRHGLLSDLKKNEDQELKPENLKKIANYFKVPLDYFFESSELSPSDIPPEPEITDSQLLFALYGEVPDEITDEDISDIKKYADFVRQRKKTENKED